MSHASRAVRAPLTALLVLTLPPALSAQEDSRPPTVDSGQGAWRIEVTPFVGAYVPLAELLEFSDTGLILGVPARVTLEGKQTNSFAIGGRVTGWFDRRFGVEGTFTYAFSDLDVTQTIEIPTQPDRVRSATLGAYVWTAAVRAVYRLARIDRSAVILAGLGPAIIDRGGDAFSAPALGLTSAGAVDGTTDVGGVFDLGARIDAGSRVAIRLDAEVYMYTASLSLANPLFAGGDPPSSSKYQTDLVLSAGVAVGL